MLEEFSGAASVGNFVASQFRPTHNGADNVVEIMSDAASEFANGLKLLKLADAQLGAFLLGAILRLPKLALDCRYQARKVALHDVILRANAQRIHGDVFANGSGEKDEGH